MTLKLKEAVGRATGNPGRSSSKKKLTRVISYGETPHYTSDNVKAGKAQNLARDKRIKSVTILPANAIASKANTSIVVQNRAVALRKAKARTSVQVEYNILSKAQTRRSLSRCNSYSSYDGSSTPRAPRTPRTPRTPKVNFNSNKSPRRSISSPLSAIPAIPPPIRRLRIDPGNFDNPATRIRSPTSARLFRRSSSAQLKVTTPRMASPRWDIGNYGSPIMSARRRGNKMSPSPFTFNPLPIDSVSSSPPRRVRQAWGVTGKEEYNNHRNQKKQSNDQSKATLSREVEGIKGPSLSTTTRKGPKRYAPTTHSNTPDSVSRQVPPVPVKGVYSRLLPYSNERGRSASWASHVNKSPGKARRYSYTTRQ